MEILILFNFIAILGQGLFSFGHEQILHKCIWTSESVPPSASCVFSRMNPEGLKKKNSLLKYNSTCHKIHLFKVYR